MNPSGRGLKEGLENLECTLRHVTEGAETPLSAHLRGMAVVSDVSYMERNLSALCDRWKSRPPIVGEGWTDLDFLVWAGKLREAWKHGRKQMEEQGALPYFHVEKPVPEGMENWVAVGGCVAQLDLLVDIHIHLPNLLDTEGKLEVQTGIGNIGDLAEGGHNRLLFVIHGIVAGGHHDYHRDRQHRRQKDVAQPLPVEGGFGLGRVVLYPFVILVHWAFPFCFISNSLHNIVNYSILM